MMELRFNVYFSVPSIVLVVGSTLEWFHFDRTEIELGTVSKIP